MNDLISRQAALDIIDSELNGWLTDDERLHLEGLAIGISDLPTIDPEENGGCWGCCCEKLGQVKHGKWEHNVNKNGFLMWACSICKCEKHKKKGLKFCPNCGADMRGE